MPADHAIIDLFEIINRRDLDRFSGLLTKEAEFYLKIEKAFIQEHFAHWIPIFCEKVMEETAMPLYKGMAALTKKFIEFELEEMFDKSEESP